MNPALTGLARRGPDRLAADPSRVVTMLFVPGQEGFDHHDSRSAAVVARILALSEDEVQRGFDDVVARFGHRHRDLVGTFDRHANELADRLDPGSGLSATRRLLLGATFTSEFALEGAALCNPSIVAHPDQSGAPRGSLRFVMSVRAIGEGHRSTIGFRTGLVDAEGGIVVDAPSPLATKGAPEAVPFDAAVFRGELRRLGIGGENADFVLDALGEAFTESDLAEQLGRLGSQLATRRHAASIIPVMQKIAERTYGVRFAADTSLTERTLVPEMAAENCGLEDARFVRFEHDGRPPTYYATYTAYSGTDIGQQLLETSDFAFFTSSPIVGPAAANKGLALFPRKISGRYAALSRSDRESNSIAFSDNPLHWDTAMACQTPTRSWEAVQLGNCGSPIETTAGWLVLTHGVGPMRTYSIGAIMLDLEDPTRVLGRLREPLLSPAADEQDGYVPNVVYSCGALVHRDTLVLPYGIGDGAIGLATVSMPALLDALDTGD